MAWRTALAAAAVALVGVALRGDAGPGAGAGGERMRILADELESRVQIIGRLGHELGTYVTVQGRLQDRTKDPTLLVMRVDGVALDEPVGIETYDDRLRHGVEYTLWGYERGGMTGNPSDPRRPGVGPQKPWRFTTRFVVTEVDAPRAPEGDAGGGRSVE